MKEFWSSARYRMSLPSSVNGVAGGIILPSSIPRPTVERRDLAKRYPHLQRRLLDPQLYLAELYPALCRKACANLASYGWFPLRKALPAYDSGQLNLATWKRSIEADITHNWTSNYPTGSDLDDSLRTAVSVQANLGVEAIILPAPLTTNPASDFSLEAEWLRRGRALAALLAPDVPAYATIAISDRAVRGEAPWGHDLLEIILDQVTAQEVRGVYLVLEQANEDGYYVSHPNTVGALLRLTHGFSSTGHAVIANFAGTAGLLLLAAGATGWSTGWYRSERRLKLTDFEAQEGRATPAFYTHPLLGEVHMQFDLDRIVRAGLLPRIEDITAASAGLLKALKSGASSSSVPEWTHAQSNVAASTEHFLLSVTRETERLSSLPTDRSREDATQSGLKAAVMLARDLYKLGDFNKRTAVSHQEGWLHAFDTFLKYR